MEHYVSLKSYANTESTGEVTIGDIDLSQFTNKNVLIVEDIIDTGNTLSAFVQLLNQHGPSSVRIVNLLQKRTDKNKSGLHGDFIGFSIPDAFVVGFGLDYNEMFRDLEHIAVIAKSGIDKYRREVEL